MKLQGVQYWTWAGLAFGTGTHETTRLCLELLEQFVGPSSEVLDVGCGSGITLGSSAPAWGSEGRRCRH